MHSEESESVGVANEGERIKTVNSFESSALTGAPTEEGVRDQNKAQVSESTRFPSWSGESPREAMTSRQVLVVKWSDSKESASQVSKEAKVSISVLHLFTLDQSFLVKSYQLMRIVFFREFQNGNHLFLYLWRRLTATELVYANLSRFWYFSH